MRLRTGWTRAAVTRAFQEGTPIHWLIYGALEGTAGKQLTVRVYQEAFEYIERIIRRESRKGKRG